MYNLSEQPNDVNNIDPEKLKLIRTGTLTFIWMKTNNAELKSLLKKVIQGEV